MDAKELLKLVEAGDLHGLMLYVNRAWLTAYYPEADHASLVVGLGRRLPVTQLVIPSSASAAGRSPPGAAPSPSAA
jgi:hypothetical protein